MAFNEQYSVRSYQFPVKVTFKQTVKNNNYWIFLIFFACTLAFCMGLETTDGWIAQRVLLYIWVASGRQLIAIETIQ